MVQLTAEQLTTSRSELILGTVKIKKMDERLLLKGR